MALMLYDPSTSTAETKEVNGDQEVYRFKFDLQPGSLTVQVAGEHQP